MNKKTFAVSIAAALYFAPLVAFAQIQNICNVVQVVNNIARWFGITVFAVAAIGILYAAFRFLTSQGDAEKAKEARMTLVYSLVGIAVALLSTNASGIIKATVGGAEFDPASCIVTPATGVR